MANPICNSTTLVTNGACYRQETINPNQQKSLLIYAKVLQLAAIGGTDYTAQLSGTLTTLLSDSVCPPVLPDHIRAANIAIAFANATSAGATVPSTIEAKMANTACLQQVPGGPNRLDQIDMWLNCQLGRSKAYPQ